MLNRQKVLLASLATLMGCGGCDSPSDPVDDQEPPPPPPPGTTVAVNLAVQHQTMTGWQANAQAGQWEPGFAQWRDAVMDRAVSDGINRLRMDTRSGIENTRNAFSEFFSGAITMNDWRCVRYATVNDNANPAVLDISRFNFSELDTAMSRVVLPLRQRLQAKGETLGLTITYVAFTWQNCAGTQYHHTDAEEYAEFAVAVMTYLRDRYGVVPDTWELINEPDNTAGVWTQDRIRLAVLAIDRRLSQAGFQTSIIAPSHSSAASARSSAEALMATPAAPMIDQIGYHRYDGPTDANVKALGDLAAARGISTAMTEHIGSGYENLIKDVTLGRASAWEQYTLAYPGEGDNGGAYYTIQGSTVTTGSRTKYLRHYFRHVRRGAVRVDATSETPSVVPVAFRNVNGRVAVILKYDSPGVITIGGLPAGRYGVGFESEATSDGSLPDVTVGSDGIATLQVQSRGVVALFGR